MTFGVLYENLKHLSDATHLSKGVTLSNYWQYSIVIELIKACAKTDPSTYGDLLRDGPVSKHRDVSLNRRLMGLIEEAWNLVDDFTALRPASNTAKANMLASSGLSSDVLHDLSVFPLGPEYELVKREFFKRVSAHKHRVTLILDGFDTLITNDIKAKSIQLIFASLVDAILSLRKYEDLPSCIGIKALIPHDRYMNLSLRDSDKVGAMHTAIRWNMETLKEFVEKRIVITPAIRPGSFQALWRQVLPITVTNSFYKIEEDSFEFILRHTMLRPRQLQMHLDELAKRHRGCSIDPTMIPKSIADSSRKLARYFIDEYCLDHPNLERFILMFEQRSNVMEFRTFRDMLSTALVRFRGQDHGLDVDDEVDALYAIGLFGIVRFVEQDDVLQEQYYPPTKNSRRHYVDFFFRKPFTKVSSRLDDDSLVAIHPMLVDFANLRLHPTLLIG